jgi:multidrug transporter EmrE-like cation transporter
MIFNTVIPYIFSISLCESFAQICIKYYYISNNLLYFFLAILFYTCVTYLLFKTYAIKEMSLVNVLWSGMSVIIMLAIGIILFNERIHLHDWIGIFLIVLGMTFVNVNNKYKE